MPRSWAQLDLCEGSFAWKGGLGPIDRAPLQRSETAYYCDPIVFIDSALDFVRIKGGHIAMRTTGSCR